MALSEFDRNLLQSCLAKEPRSWENFVDRFLGLVLHVVNHAASTRSLRLTDQDREDLVSEVFLAVVRDDFAVLRQFRGRSSLATYLTVVARRVVVRQLMKRGTVATLTTDVDVANPSANFESRISAKEEVDRLLADLSQTEAAVIRMYHLEGKSYGEISSVVGMPENSVGPMLSRARSKMRNKAQTS